MPADLPAPDRPPPAALAPAAISRRHHPLPGCDRAALWTPPLAAVSVAAAAVIATPVGWITVRALACTLTAAAAVAAAEAVTGWTRLHHVRRHTDRWIATGCGLPPGDAVIAARTAELLDPRSRRRLARTVRGLRRDATARTVTRIRPAQVNARRLRGHVDDLDAIAAALDAVGAPLGARAAALVQLLVADGAGPLYNPARGDDLPAALARVRRAVDG